MQQPERKGILALKDFNEEQEIEFELDYQISKCAKKQELVEDWISPLL
ncbi:hypothetical protein ACFLT2_11915 [Acidobacteriota bacterium]